MSKDDDRLEQWKKILRWLGIAGAAEGRNREVPRHAEPAAVESVTDLAESRVSGADHPAETAQADGPVVSVNPIGQLANRMIQHMVALAIVARVPGARISRVHLPEWGIDEQAFPTLPLPMERIEGNVAPIDDIAERMRTGKTGTAEITGYVQNMSNFLPPSAYRHVFVSNINVDGFGPNELLISLRMLEILSGNFPPYVLIPISFYREVIEETGLEPVFFGQLSASPYLDELRATFPDAKFVNGSGVIRDFEAIRRSANILISVSTFAWCAAWLSEAKRIIMPLTGLFNPVYAQIDCRGLNLIPRNDPRYEFYLFPTNVAVKEDRLGVAHAALDGRWRKIDSDQIDDIFRRRAGLHPSLDNHLSLFDEQFYLSAYPDLGRLVSGGHLSSGRDHYAMYGFRERRLPFPIEMSYLYRYPDAASGISNGDYLDLAHFHAERGAALGYVPVAATS